MEKVSVIIPAYNKAVLTVKTVESVLNQTYKNIEIIVVDDGSTDDTMRLLSDYSNKIKYVYKKNGGACSARNVGIKLSTGGYIALLDCDDIYLPEKIELSVDYLKRNPESGFVYTKVYFIDDSDNILREYPNPKYLRCGYIKKNLLLKNFIPNSTVIIRKSCFEKTGYFNEAIFIPADWDMWIRLSENYQAGYINLPLTKYRASGSYILKNLQQTEKEDLIILTKAFSRNKETSRYFKNRVLSNEYLRSAINYTLAGDFGSVRNKLFLALQKNILNLKALLILAFFLFSRKGLRGLLIKKIFSKDIFDDLQKIVN